MQTERRVSLLDYEINFTWAKFRMVPANPSECMKLNIDNLLRPRGIDYELISSFFIPVLLNFGNGYIVKAGHYIHRLFLISNWRPFQLAGFHNLYMICRILLMLADDFQVELKFITFR